MILQINGVNYTPIMPPCIERTLDESFDRAHMILKYISVSTPFQPFTVAYIDSEKWYIAQDDVSETVGAGSKRFTHELILVEETIILTRILSASKTFTQALTVINPEVPQAAPYTQTADGITDTSPIYTFTNPFTTPRYIDNATTIAVPSILDLISFPSQYVITTYNGGFADYGIEVTKNGEFVTGQTPTGAMYNGAAITPALGNYMVRYSFDAYISGYPEMAVSYVLTFTFTITQATGAPTDYTITSVINTLLSTAEPLRLGESPSITLNSTQATLFASKTAPEFSFSNGQSLWEMLSEVGKWVHGIPRLVNGVLQFDMLGGTTYATITGQPMTSTESVSMERYCSTIEGIVDNVVSDTKFSGSIQDASYTTLRAKTETVRINEESGLIQTLFPIESVTSIKCGYKQGSNARVEIGDITSYLYENTLYNLLSSYGSTTGGSKAYALYYTQGSRNIEGLFFKQPNVVSGVFAQYAIANIIEAVAEDDTIFNVFTSADYYNLDFVVTYIPIISVRARQHKMETGYTESVIAYNQSADKVSASMLGRSMKNQVAMMSTADKTVTYLFDSLADVPACGTLYDDIYYIAKCTSELYKSHIKSTLTLQANYNRMSKYIALPNKIRQFEVSGKNVLDRHILYEDYCVIGDYEGNNNALLTEIGRGFVTSALGVQSNFEPIKTAIVTMLDADENFIANTCVLPVIGVPFGNSILWSMAFEDNYSAGRKSVAAYTAESGSYRTQDFVTYADYYGRAEYLQVALYNHITAESASITAVGHSLPALPSTGITRGALLATTGENHLLIKKDGRERILFTYQLHFVSNNGIIIGSDFSDAQSLVSEIASSPAARLYTYSTRINTFTGATATGGRSAALVFGTTSGVPYVDCDAVMTGTSWAIIKDGKFMMGANGAFERIYFNFRHKPIEDIEYSESGEYEENPEEPEEDPATTYAIAYSLSNIISSNTQSIIAEGANYYTELSTSGNYYTPNSITVLRKGNPIFSGYTYTKTGSYTATLSIPGTTITDNITIQASGTVYTSTLILPYLDVNADPYSEFNANVGGVTYYAEDTVKVQITMNYGATAQLIWKSTTHYATVTIGAGGDNPYTITMTPTNGYAYYSFNVYGTIDITYTATAIQSLKSLNLEDSSNGTDLSNGSVTVGIFYGDTEVQYVWDYSIQDGGWTLSGIPYNSVIYFYWTQLDGSADITIKNGQGQNAGQFSISNAHPSQAIQINTSFWVTVVVTYD